METTVRECEDEVGEDGGRDEGDSQPDRERQRSVCLDKRSGEEREPGAHHERARPSLAAAGRSDEACRDERDTGHDRESSQSRAVAPKLAARDCGRSQGSACGCGNADPDDDRVPA